MKVTVNLEQLRSVDEPLYNRWVSFLKLKGADPANVTSLTVDTEAGYWEGPMVALQELVKSDKWQSAAQPPQPRTDLYEEQRRRAAEQEQVQRQRQADEQQAVAYLQKLARDEGLVDCKENADKLMNYLNERKQFASLTTVTAAVTALKDQLDWNRPEVVGTLQNGEKQLPLDASDSDMKRASVAQLRDLSKRRGEGQSRPTGAFGSRY